jgi:nucleotidyltransferase-like protein
MGKEIERARAFAAELAGVYGDQLVSAALYGSAARGEYREGVSDLNLLVLLKEASPAALRRGARLARGWVAERNPPPLVLSEDEWRSSADVWPIEMSDIRDAHLVLHGSDPFAEVEIDPADLRRQLESELKGKHVRLRERYLMSAEEPAELEALLLQSFPTFLVLFRTVLRLDGDEAPREAEAVIRLAGERAGFDPAPLLEVHRARGGGAKLEARSDAPVVVGYLDAVERVVRYVDRYVDGTA